MRRRGNRTYIKTFRFPRRQYIKCMCAKGVIEEEYTNEMQFMAGGDSQEKRRDERERT